MIEARLPVNERPIVPLSDERRAAFKTNVSAALERAADDPDRPFPETEETPADNSPLIQVSCGACRGNCCSYGEDRAYLFPNHFRRLLRDHPGRSREEILTAYLSRLPERVYRDSCVYHSETGCALPRELRSNLCNTYLCGPLSEVVYAQSLTPRPVRLLFAQDPASAPVRTAEFNPVTKPPATSSVE